MLALVAVKYKIKSENGRLKMNENEGYGIRMNLLFFGSLTPLLFMQMIYAGYHGNMLR